MQARLDIRQRSRMFDTAPGIDANEDNIHQTMTHARRSGLWGLWAPVPRELATPSPLEKDFSQLFLLC